VKIGAAQKGKFMSPEVRQKIRESLIGCSRPDGAVEKQVATRRENQKKKGYNWHSEETRQRISAANKGRPCSEEHKQKIRETLLRRHQKQLLIEQTTN
jgi:plasmid stability protein